MTKPHIEHHPHTTAPAQSQMPKATPELELSPASPSGLQNRHEETPRGRLKRRRLSSHSPIRSISPSRGHDRDSGSRHRQHYRKHQRASSRSSFSITPPPLPVNKKNRRRSDAEPDHTLRGRARNRSHSRNRTRSPISEGEENENEERVHRRRSPPPSRHRSESAVDARRQRSLPNMYRGQRGRGKGEDQRHAVYGTVVLDTAL